MIGKIKDCLRDNSGLSPRALEDTETDEEIEACARHILSYLDDYLCRPKNVSLSNDVDEFIDWFNDHFKQFSDEADADIAS